MPVLSETIFAFKDISFIRFAIILPISSIFTIIASPPQLDIIILRYAIPYYEVRLVIHVKNYEKAYFQVRSAMLKYVYPNLINHPVYKTILLAKWYFLIRKVLL